MINSIEYNYFKRSFSKPWLGITQANLACQGIVLPEEAMVVTMPLSI